MALVEDNKVVKLRIIVTTKDFGIFKSEIYTPSIKLDIPIRKNNNVNTGEFTSEYNGFINELTSSFLNTAFYDEKGDLVIIPHNILVNSMIKIEHIDKRK